MHSSPKRVSYNSKRKYSTPKVAPSNQALGAHGHSDKSPTEDPQLVSRADMKVAIMNSLTPEQLDAYNQIQRSTEPGRFMLRHDWHIKIAWDVFVVLLVLYSSFWIPIDIVFDVTLHGGTERGVSSTTSSALEITEIVIDVIFYIDIILSFRTTYTTEIDRHTVFVKEPKAVAVNYLRTWFIIDFLAAVPKPSKTLSAVKLLKVLRLARVKKMLKRYGGTNLIRMVWLIFAFLLFVHFTACAWFIVGKSTVDEREENWLVKAGIADETPIYQYLTSLYFALVTLTTVGYGDIHGVTMLEKSFVCIIIIAGAVFYASIFGNIGLVLADMDAADLLKRSRRHEVMSVVRAFHLEKDLERRMLETFEELWTMSSGIDPMEVLGAFPLSLQYDFSMYVNEGLLSKVDAFRETERAFFKKVTHIMRPQVFIKDEFVFLKGDTGSRMYFVFQGEIWMFVDDGVKEQFREGDCFGMFALLTGEKRYGHAWAICTSVLLYIQQADFETCLLDFPNIKQKFKEIAEDKYKSLVKASAQASGNHSPRGEEHALELPDDTNCKGADAIEPGKPDQHPVKELELNEEERPCPCQCCVRIDEIIDEMESILGRAKPFVAFPKLHEHLATMRALLHNPDRPEAPAFSSVAKVPPSYTERLEGPVLFPGSVNSESKKHTPILDVGEDHIWIDYTSDETNTSDTYTLPPKM